MRRVPFDGAAQELRRAEKHLCHDLDGDRRRLRGLPRPRLGPRRLGGAPEEPTALGQRRDDGLTVHFDERRDVSWTIDPAATGNARRSTPRTSAKELETCGMCHSRSSKFAEPWRPGQPLLQTHLPQDLLAPGPEPAVACHRRVRDGATGQRRSPRAPAQPGQSLFAAAGPPKLKRNIPPPAPSTLASRRSMSALPSFMRNRAATPMASAPCARR